MPRDGSGLLFPNKDGKKLSNMTMQKLFKSMRPGLTVHGFRSAAKDWCAENGGRPQNVPAFRPFPWQFVHDMFP
jgi:hypothetical protein